MVPPWTVRSPIRAAGWFMMSTVKEPRAMTSGGPTHTAMSPTRAAGSPPISTVTAQGGSIGPPTCGTSPVTMGQTCISVTLAAGIPISALLGLLRPPQLNALRHVEALRDEAPELLRRLLRLRADRGDGYRAGHRPGGVVLTRGNRRHLGGSHAAAAEERAQPSA